MNITNNKSPLFQITGLSHSFGGLSAVSGFNLSVEPGAVWGIIGPNGAGKTTVFNLITGVYKPDRGSVKLRNEDITGLASHRIIARGISRTFQNIRLFKSMTVLDNVRTAGYCRLGYPLWSAFVRDKKFRSMENEVLHDAGKILDTFGLLGRQSETAANLPYGLQRKVELSRALISRPCLLLLDEPAAGMNPSELDDLCDLILRVQKEFNLTIILIEHRMRLVMKLCELVKVLNFGETIYDGRPADLASDQAVVKAYFGEGHAPALH
jgi:branched-chain amino acid transport system ATP-binding protein